MYRFKRGLLPSYFRNIFTRASHIHSHHISNSSRFSQKGDKRVHTRLAHLTSISCDHFSWPGIGTYFLPCLFTIDKTFVSLCLLDRFVYTFFSQLGLFTFISKRLGTMINA